VLDLKEVIPGKVGEGVTRHPNNSPLMMVEMGAAVSRYWYHLPRGRRTPVGALRAYTIRETEAADSFRGDYKNGKYIWLAHYPLYGKGMYIIDITKLNNDDMRFTGQAEGHMLHRGDIPASAIVGRTNPIRRNPMSWKVGVKVRGEEGLTFNAQRFATRAEAGKAGEDIFSRWTAVEQFKLVKSTDPVNYRMVAGRQERIEGNPAKPHTQVEVFRIPKCDFCEKPAQYDGRTGIGPWANMCQMHFYEYGTGLGLGKGQKLILKKNPDSGYVPCRCCGKPVAAWLGSPIHTKCIPKHWGKHVHGQDASRCKEFGRQVTEEII
jgi:hypothetical protein